MFHINNLCTTNTPTLAVMYYYALVVVDKTTLFSFFVLNVQRHAWSTEHMASRSAFSDLGTIYINRNPELPMA